MIKTIAKKFGQWASYRNTVRELSSLSNRELNDLGISRHEIQTVARRSAIDNL